MTRVVVAADRIDRGGLAILDETAGFEVVEVPDTSVAEFSDILAKAEGLIVRSATTVDSDLLARAPALRAIGRAGVGVDNIDIAAATARGIAVFNAPGGNTVAAAELTMGLMLALARRVVEADRSMREGRWDRSSFKGSELSGKTLGLVGAGRVGSEVAARAMVFGMDVLVYDPYLTEERAAEVGFRLTTLDEVLGLADFVSVHVPLTDETAGLLGSGALARMKDSCYLVNAARGGVIDESALAEALNDGAIAGAALDVYATEPLPDDSPLRAAPNLIMTPHLGASTSEAQVRVAAEVAEKIKAALLDGELSAALNAAALS